MSRTRAQQRPRIEHGHQGRTSEEKPMAKYLLLKHYRGGPTPVVDFALIDQWTPDEVDAHMQFMGDFEARLRESGDRAVELAGELSAAPGPGGTPIHEWLEVRPFLSDSPAVTE